MTSKKDAQRFLVNEIIYYLENLQGGKWGTPTLDDLQNAGNLHNFIENTPIEKNMKFKIGCKKDDESLLDKYKEEIGKLREINFDNRFVHDIYKILRDFRVILGNNCSGVDIYDLDTDSVEELTW